MYSGSNRVRWLPLLAMLLHCASSRGAVSFEEDVMASLSKAGCNLGTCHGNATGKGGFKLSLRGQDAVLDHLALTVDAGGRRVNTFAADQSLILQKATNRIAHEGGKRFSPESWEYKVLSEWIAAGAAKGKTSKPKPAKLIVTPAAQTLDEKIVTLQLNASVTYDDGSVKDVTARAVYEPLQNGLVEISHDGLVKRLQFGEPSILVRYLGLSQSVRLLWVKRDADFAWQPQVPHNYVDQHIFAKLKALGINTSPMADDRDFLRRLSLDLLGHLPDGRTAKAFMVDARPDKRLRLIDSFLAHPDFVDFWTMKWADLLKVESRTLDAVGMKAFHSWIRESIRTGKPLDVFARELIAARGSTYHEPASNFYRANRTPVDRAVNTAQVFLGTRLQCAQCHNHPFDRWTQDDYYSWAAVFGRVDYKILSDIKPKDKSDKHEFNGEQVVFLKQAKDSSVENPRTGAMAKPRVLGAELPSAADELQGAAQWLTGKDNRLFAAAQANRIWYHLMGKGLVDPVDDFRLTNPASHPELLEALTDDLISSGYDMRHLIRTILSSATYQLSSTPTNNNLADSLNYSHNIPRRLSAEQLFDSLHLALDLRPQFDGSDRGLRATQKAGPINGKSAAKLDPQSPEAFLAQFGKPARQLVCECERSSSTTLSQAFQLISGPLMNELIGDGRNLIHRHELSLEDLFWQTLSRPPTDAERKALEPLLAKNRRLALEDITWSLLNSKEFLLR